VAEKVMGNRVINDEILGYWNGCQSGINDVEVSAAAMFPIPVLVVIPVAFF